jgi:hypothetical protein
VDYFASLIDAESEKDDKDIIRFEKDDKDIIRQADYVLIIFLRLGGLRCQV